MGPNLQGCVAIDPAGKVAINRLNADALLIFTGIQPDGSADNCRCRSHSAPTGLEKPFYRSLTPVNLPWPHSPVPRLET